MMGGYDFEYKEVKKLIKHNGWVIGGPKIVAIGEVQVYRLF